MALSLNIQGTYTYAYPSTPTSSYQLIGELSLPVILGAGFYDLQGNRYTPNTFLNIQPQFNENRQYIRPLFLAKFMNIRDDALIDYKIYLFADDKKVETIDSESKNYIYPAGLVPERPTGVDTVPHYKAFRFRGFSDWDDFEIIEGTYWHDIAYGDNKFVAVGNRGIYSSMYLQNNVSWTPVDRENENVAWYVVAHGGGRFVALGRQWTDFDEDKINVTQDSENWSQSIRTNNIWNPDFSQLTAEGVFLTPSLLTQSYANYSDDGVNWSKVELPLTSDWELLVYADNKFIAFSTQPTQNYLTSEDGQSWTVHSDLPIVQQWGDVIYANDKIIVLAGDQSGKSLISEDKGSTWRVADTPSGYWSGICYGDGIFAAVSLEGLLMTSSDGENWTLIDIEEKNAWYDIEFGSHNFIAIAGNGNRRMLFSEDGVNWLLTDDAELSAWHSIAYGSLNGVNTFMALSLLGDHNCMLSYDYLQQYTEAVTYSIVAQLWYESEFIQEITPNIADLPTLYKYEKGYNSYMLTPHVNGTYEEDYMRGSIIQASNYSNVGDYLIGLTQAYTEGIADTQFKDIINRIHEHQPNPGDKIGNYDRDSLHITQYLDALSECMHYLNDVILSKISVDPLMPLPEYLNPFYGEIAKLTYDGFVRGEFVMRDQTEYNLPYDQFILGPNGFLDLLSSL